MWKPQEGSADGGIRKKKNVIIVLKIDLGN